VGPTRNERVSPLEPRQWTVFRQKKGYDKLRTQVCHTSNLTCDLFLCIFPESGQEVYDEVYRLFPRLKDGPKMGHEVASVYAC
jgi:hypothetical protein